MILLLTGILASTVHVVSGPDHLAAVGPLAIESQKKSWKIGLLWGLGHTFGVLIIGLFFLMFRDFIPIDAISGYSESLVGIILILIGFWAFYKIRKHNSSVHPHPHPHNHLHQYSRNTVAAASVGILHGLAGVSHLLGIIPTLALPSKLDASLYIAGFGVGTISSMIIFASILGHLSYSFSENKKEKLLTSLQLTGGFAAVIVGIFWITNSILQV
ncbi:MAG: sulfite exporter TauE/SafE family protein [Bacteroidales bacterium]|nr:sulfite exporter TauE/SafE family protein [Bacteroidales bacterium]